MGKSGANPRRRRGHFTRELADILDYYRAAAGGRLGKPDQAHEGTPPDQGQSLSCEDPEAPMAIGFAADSPVERRRPGRDLRVNERDRRAHQRDDDSERRRIDRRLTTMVMSL